MWLTEMMIWMDEDHILKKKALYFLTGVIKEPWWLKKVLQGHPKDMHDWV